MSYHVRTDEFEGPFEILLYLVGRKQVDIGSISVANIADQYLEEISRLNLVDLDVASDFLLVASTLLELKAASLIPHKKSETEEEIAELSPGEAQKLLFEKLLEYKKFKNVSMMLSTRGEAQSKLHARTFGAPSELAKDIMPDFLKGIPIEALSTLAARIFARREAALLEANHIAAKPIPVEVFVRSIHGRIKTQKTLHFSDLIEEGVSKSVVVVSFLALLELYKRSMVKIKQDTQYGDIEINYIEGSGELVFDEQSDDMEE